MTPALWYLRHGVPWTALLGCLLAATGAAGLLHRWGELTGVALPLVLLVSAAAAGFLLDEPAVAVTTVTPRGGRWGPGLRAAAAVLPAGVGLGLLLTVPADVRPDRSDAALVLTGLTGFVVMLALVGTRRQFARAGSAIASAVVLLGLTPVVLGGFVDLASPYPLSALTDEVRTAWLAALLVGVLASGLLVGRDGAVADTVLMSRPRA